MDTQVFRNTPGGTMLFKASPYSGVPGPATDSPYATIRLAEESKEEALEEGPEAEPAEVEPGKDPVTYTLKIETPSGKLIPLQVLPQDSLMEVRQYLMEHPDTCHLTSYDFTHNGDVVNDVVELSEVPGMAVEGSLVFEMQLRPYSKREAVFHVRKLRDLLRALKHPEDVASPSMLRHLLLSNRSKRKQKRASAEVAEDRSGSDLFVPVSLESFYPSGAEHSGMPACFRSLRMSGWNPPPAHRQLLGDLFYLEICTLENDLLHVTASVDGFYVNSSTLSEFAPMPSASAHRSHSLTDLLKAASPQFKGAYTAFLKRLNKADPLETLRPPLPVFPWVAMVKKHRYDPSRAEDDLIEQGEVGEHPGALRDWNEEFQSAKELPSDEPAVKAMRDMRLSRTAADFADAVRQAAVLVVHGDVPPVNPGEPREQQMFMFNNIFLSFANDGSEGFQEHGGDESAYKSASADLKGVVRYNMANEPRFYTLATAIVDYKGHRVMAQSMIPGILTREANTKVQYGSQDHGSTFEMYDPEFVEILQAVSTKMQHCPQSYSLPGSPDFLPLAGAVEVKGIKGGDGRHYFLDLARYTCRDLNFPDQKHHSRILRPELLQSFMEVINHIRNREARLRRAQEEYAAREPGVEMEDPATRSDLQPFEVERMVLTKLPDLTSNFPPAGQPIQFDPNLGVIPDESVEMNTAVSSARYFTRMAAVFLREVLIPVVHSEFLKSASAPLDGRALTDLLHQRGINVRYLGQLCELADASRMYILQELYQREMITRCAKHLLNERLRNTDHSKVASVAASFLNSFLSPPSDTRSGTLRGDARQLWGAIKTDCVSRFGYTLQDESLSSVVCWPATVRSLCLKVGLQVAARDYDWEAKSPFRPGDIVKMVPLVKSCAPPPSDALHLMELALQCRGQNRSDYALLFYQEAIRALQDVVGPLHTSVAECYQNMAIIHKMMGSNEALRCQQMAVTIFERAVGLDDARTASAYSLLSELYGGIANYSQAILLCKRAIYLVFLCAGPNRNEFILMLQTLANLYSHAQAFEAAAQTAEALLRLARKLFGEHDMHVAEAAHNLSMSLLKLDRHEDALRYQQMRHGILSRLQGVDHELTKDAEAWIKRITNFAAKVVQGRQADKQSGRGGRGGRHKLPMGGRTGKLPTPGGKGHMGDMPLETILNFIQDKGSSRKGGKGQGKKK